MQLLIENLASFFWWIKRKKNPFKNFWWIIFRQKKDQKQSTSPSKICSNHKPVICVHLSSGEKKTQNSRKARREKEKKKCLLSDRLPSLGQINDFTRITFSNCASFRAKTYFKFRLLLILFCVFSLLFFNVWLFIEVQWTDDAAKSVWKVSFLSFPVNSSKVFYASRNLICANV